MPGASKSRAARGRDDRSQVNALPGAKKSRRGRPVPVPIAAAAESALPGAYKSHAARGRDAVASSVPAADCVLPAEMKSRRGHTAKVPVADCALPGFRFIRGRHNARDVPDAADVLQVLPGTGLSGLHNLCAHHSKVSVDTDDTSAQLSTNGINSPPN